MILIKRLYGKMSLVTCPDLGDVQSQSDKRKNTHGQKKTHTHNTHTLHLLTRDGTAASTWSGPALPGLADNGNSPLVDLLDLCLRRRNFLLDFVEGVAGSPCCVRLLNFTLMPIATLCYIYIYI